MDGLLKQLERAKGDVGAPRWTHARAADVWERVQATHAGRSRRRPLWIALPAVAAVAVAAVWALRPAPAPVVARREVAPVVPRPSSTLVLRDGSRAEPLGLESRLRLVEDSPTMAVLRIEEGAGRFEVVPDKRRRFRVEAVTGIAVEALGTVFTVGREQPSGSDADRVRVAVLIGRVRVDYPGGKAFLSHGEEGVFPPLEAAPAVVADPPAAPPARRPAQRWKKLAEERRFDAAFAALSAEGGARAVRDVPDELMLAADVARKAGHPREAITHLRRLLARHERDPRAGVAAFTLGRVHDGLAEQAAAARAFAEARRLSPDGPLAEDALAREANAWAAAAESERAARAARLYLERHPQGHHAAAMKRLAR